MPELIINELSCQKGYSTLFSKLSLSLIAGDILRISGANGSGKTSLLKILAGLNSAEIGNVSFQGNLVRSSEYQENIFYFGHLPALSPELSCQENLNYLVNLQGGHTQSQVINALAAIGLKGYESEYAANLSAGQKRRVVLATLFINNAPIWILDEPFTALDTNGITALEAQINKHSNNGGICILTTHQNCNLSKMKTLSL
jgi:heme exporter protein A